VKPKKPGPHLARYLSKSQRPKGCSYSAHCLILSIKRYSGNVDFDTEHFDKRNWWHRVSYFIGSLFTIFTIGQGQGGSFVLFLIFPFDLGCGIVTSHGFNTSESV